MYEIWLRAKLSIFSYISTAPEDVSLKVWRAEACMGLRRFSDALRDLDDLCCVRPNWTEVRAIFADFADYLHIGKILLFRNSVNKININFTFAFRLFLSFILHTHWQFHSYAISVGLARAHSGIWHNSHSSILAYISIQFIFISFQNI